MDISLYRNYIENEYEKKFVFLYEMLVDYNKKVNITAITQKEQVFEKHFLDSVLGESLFKKNAEVVEIGSGGGFPSLPLKLLREDLNITLVESTAKKCVYLQNCVKELNLDRVNVVNARAEELAKKHEFREKFDCATARAVARMNTLCEYCLPFVKVGGSFIAYKGEADEELNEAEKAIKILGGKVNRVEKYSLPSGEKRTLIEVLKVAPTPEKYPRGQGKERKNPIK